LGASEIEAKVKSDTDNLREYIIQTGPDKNNQAETGLTTEEASKFFKLLNNTIRTNTSRKECDRI
jgi:hypothetical protein